MVAVAEQGDGHLIHYKKVELVALQVLQLLKASERLRNSLLHDSNADEDTPGYTIFHAVVEFLKSFCESEPHYRALFVKKEVFEFLVSCIALAEEVPVSQMLVSVFANNDMRVNMQFVDQLIKAVDENFSKNKQSSLNALLVLKSIVTTFAPRPQPNHLLIRCNQKHKYGCPTVDRCNSHQETNHVQVLVARGEAAPEAALAI
ncbi:unnamed protein product [Effrenium voratum]|uniref:Uncharacterized protein n=1 Tax=Effrenium voratum TaxID=2562239 RepID=A0AA36NDL9_9DINO|nr:unnamed protein product [Effrenium voratum]